MKRVCDELKHWIAAGGTLLFFCLAQFSCAAQESAAFQEDYTPTEQNPGKFSFRCEKFDSFAGTVTVVMREAGGRQISYVLREENLYSGNLAAPSGRYTILEAEAEWDGKRYQTTYLADSYEINEGGFLLIRLEVLETCVGMADTLEEEPERRALSDTERPDAESGAEAAATTESGTEAAAAMESGTKAVAAMESAPQEAISKESGKEKAEGASGQEQTLNQLLFLCLAIWGVIGICMRKKRR